MKRWFELLLGVVLVGVWAVVAATASDATVRDDAAPAGAVGITVPGRVG